RSARRDRDRARPVRGPDAGAGVGVRARREPRARRIHRALLADQQGRGPRILDPGSQRQRDGPARPDRARRSALRPAPRVRDHLPRVLRDRPPRDVRQGHRGAPVMTPATTSEPRDQHLGAEARMMGAYLAVALVALFGGAVTGFLQALDHAKINLYPW